MDYQLTEANLGGTNLGLIGTNWKLLISVEKAITAMANPRPLKLFNVAILQSLKNAILEQSRLDLYEKSKFWPSK